MYLIGEKSTEASFSFFNENIRLSLTDRTWTRTARFKEENAKPTYGRTRRFTEIERTQTNSDDKIENFKITPELLLKMMLESSSTTQTTTTINHSNVKRNNKENQVGIWEFSSFQSFFSVNSVV